MRPGPTPPPGQGALLAAGQTYHRFSQRGRVSRVPLPLHLCPLSPQWNQYPCYHGKPDLPALAGIHRPLLLLPKVASSQLPHWPGGEPLPQSQGKLESERLLAPPFSWKCFSATLDHTRVPCCSRPSVRSWQCTRLFAEKGKPSLKTAGMLHLPLPPVTRVQTVSRGSDLPVQPLLSSCFPWLPGR